MNLLARFLCLCMLAASAGPLQAVPYSDFFVLGDSGSDSGNNALLTPLRSVPPYDPVAFFPYPSGTYSDGPIWADYLAGRFSKQTAPSLAGGTNYAFGGARITNGPQPVPDLDVQAALLLSDFSNMLPSGALYMLWGGTNDALDALGANDPAIIDAALAAYGDIIRALAAAGAQDLLVLNLGDGGLLPLFNSDAITSAAATFYTSLFNAGLDSLLDGLDQELLGINLIRFDTFAFSRRLASDPGAFGFADVDSACIIPGTITPPTQCTNPDLFFFWDFLHATTAGNASLADEIHGQIPLPGTPALLLLGLLFLCVRRPGPDALLS